jgi:hypothetical protein
LLLFPLQQNCEGGVETCKVCEDPSEPYGVDGASGTCAPCRVANCANCQVDADRCSLCEGGFWNDEQRALCTPVSGLPLYPWKSVRGEGRGCSFRCGV